MHVSRQPNSKRWVQSNSPFSLVLRDRVERKRLLSLDRSFWRRLTETESEIDWECEQWDGEAGEWEREWRKSVTDQCVRGWDSEWESVCSVWERGWGWGWVTEESDLCEVRGVIFENVLFETRVFETRFNFLRKPSLRDSSLGCGTYVELET